MLYLPTYRFIPIDCIMPTMLHTSHVSYRLYVLYTLYHNDATFHVVSYYIIFQIETAPFHATICFHLYTCIYFYFVNIVSTYIVSCHLFLPASYLTILYHPCYIYHIVYATLYLTTTYLTIDILPIHPNILLISLYEI